MSQHTPPQLKPLEERLYEYACNIVDSWSFDTMKEYAETEIHEEIKTKFLYEPSKLEQEMKEFYEENKPSKNKKFKEVTIIHEYTVAIEDKITVPVDAIIDDVYIKWGNIDLLASFDEDSLAPVEQKCVGTIKSNLNYEMDFKRPDSVVVFDENKVLVSYGDNAEGNEKAFQSILDRKNKLKGEDNA